MLIKCLTYDFERIQHGQVQRPLPWKQPIHDLYHDLGYLKVSLM